MLAFVIWGMAWGRWAGEWRKMNVWEVCKEERTLMDRESSEVLGAHV